MAAARKAQPPPMAHKTAIDLADRGQRSTLTGRTSLPMLILIRYSGLPSRIHFAGITTRRSLCSASEMDPLCQIASGFTQVCRCSCAAFQTSLNVARDRRRTPTHSKTLGFLSAGKRAISICRAGGIAAVMPAVPALGDSTWKAELKLGQGQILVTTASGCSGDCVRWWYAEWRPPQWQASRIPRRSRRAPRARRR